MKMANNCFVVAGIRAWPKLPAGGDDLALSIRDLGLLLNAWIPINGLQV